MLPNTCGTTKQNYNQSENKTVGSPILKKIPQGNCNHLHGRPIKTLHPLNYSIPSWFTTIRAFSQLRITGLWAQLRSGAHPCQHARPSENPRRYHTRLKRSCGWEHGIGLPYVDGQTSCLVFVLSWPCEILYPLRYVWAWIFGHNFRLN